MFHRYLVHPYSAQDTTEQGLFSLPVRYVPQVVWAIEQEKDRSDWTDDANWSTGYNHLSEMQWELIMGDATTQIVDSIDRVYRLLDSALNGTQYSSAPNPADPERPIIGPEIPAVPPAVGDEPLGARAQLHRLYQLAENGATGAEFGSSSAMLGTVGLDFAGSWRARLNALQGTTGGFFGIGAVPVTLADLLKAGRINTPADQGLINDGIEEILGALSSGANIGTVISNLLEAGADTVTDGGVIAATLAASLAQSVAAASLAAQLDRIIKTLDGGGLSAPSDNILATLNNVETMLS